MLIADGLMRGDLQRYEHHEARKGRLQPIANSFNRKSGVVIPLLTPSVGRPANSNSGHR